MSDTVKNLGPGSWLHLNPSNRIVLTGGHPQSDAAQQVVVGDIDELIRALRELHLVQTERAALLEEYPADVQCGVPMVHPDESVSPCIRPKSHLIDDSDHCDEHGHRATVLVHQSTIREVRAIQAARDAGLID